MINKDIINKVFKVVLIVFMIFWVGKEVVYPGITAAIYSNEYIKLVGQCDEAMESDWYNRQNDLTNEADNIQLLSCHEYDKLRKTLLMSGLPKEYISWLGLKSLEIHQRPASEFVEHHKFEYR